MDRATAGNYGDSAAGKNKNAGVGRENEGLKRENAELRSAKEAQDRKNAEQDRQIADLKRTNGALWKKTAEQDAKIADRDRENAALRREVAELKAVNTERDWKDKARDEKLAQLETVFGELRKERGDHSGPPKPSARIDNRAEGGGPSRDGERDEARRKRRLPSDAALNFGVAVAGGAATTAAGYVHYISPTMAGIGAAAATAGVTGLAWIRERRGRKAEGNADHRPEG